ncbi:hypothetical protein HpBGD84_17220 [Helicobacter pylori]
MGEEISIFNPKIMTAGKKERIQKSYANCKRAKNILFSLKLAFKHILRLPTIGEVKIRVAAGRIKKK